MHAVAHEVRKVESPEALRRSRPAPARSRARAPLGTHELDAVSGRRAGSGQRRCACGGVVGPSGECAACRAKRVAAASREAAEDEQPTLIDDVIATNVVACYGTGAVSSCNPSTGNYDITANNNTCASRSCSQLHEERHVADLGPCCMKLKNAISAGGDRNALVRQYNAWMDAGAHAWTECNAYGVSLSCVELLLLSNRCSSVSSSTCDELLDYQTSMTAQRTSWCARAPSALPACPFP